MTPIDIQSLDDSRIADFRDLPLRKTARSSGKFIVEGRLLVKRLLTSDLETESVLLDRGRHSDLLELALPSTQVYLADAAIIHQIVGFQFHSGAIACAKRPPRLPIAAAVGKGNARTVVAAPDIQDVENLGSLMRTCLALSGSAMLLGPEAADPYHRRALRCSMGAPLKLPVSESVDMVADITWLKSEGFQIIGAALQENALPLNQAQVSGDVTLLFGNEHQGLSKTMLAACDQLVAIPMEGRADSLNVGVAAGIVVHHFTHGSGRLDR